MSRHFRASLFASLLLFHATAQASTVTAEPPPTLAAIEVAGVMPGPGLWQVRSKDHVLWLIGNLRPVPRRMQWRSADLDARLAEADAILDPPSVAFNTGHGRLHALTLLPSVLAARKLPDKQTLADVLAPDLYARWSTLKAKHLGRDSGIERWRPLFAAEKLHGTVVEQAGLSPESPVSDHVNTAAKRRKLPHIPTVLAITIDDSRQALREFRQGDLDDVDCFERTLQRLEGDIALLSERALAWAIGDIDKLRTLHDSDPASACITALMDAPALRERGVDDVRAEAQALWVKAAEGALNERRTTVGVVPIAWLLADGGILATLAARGYTVLGPDEEYIDEQIKPVAP
ncbi:MAG: hypothetical protein AMXMBFR59_38610 [Rhodanobacteraceae bacterium]